MICLWHFPCLLLFFTAQNAVSHSQTVLSVKVMVDNKVTFFNFSMDMFTRFYKCLCLPSNHRCAAHGERKVFDISSCGEDGSNNTLQYFCEKHNNNVILCERRPSSDPLFLNNCVLHKFSANNTDCTQQYVYFYWKNKENATIHSYSSFVTLSSFRNNSFLLETPPTSVSPNTRPSLNPPTSGLPVTAITVLSKTSTFPSIGPAANDSSGGRQQGHDGKDTSIIIGVVVGVAVVLAIIVTIIILLWRRKKKFSSSSSTTIHDNENNDTDIYPYGDSTLNNIAPNLNSPSHDTTRDVYATVDLNKKLKKTQPLSGIKVNNVYNDNPNMSRKRQSPRSPHADYTDIELDTGADHHPGIMDVHADAEDSSGQGLALASSPEAPTKPKYYKADSEAVDASSKANNQNHMRSIRTMNEELAGSGPVGKRSEYELAKPILDTQHTSIDLTAKTKSKLTAEGLYSSAHENDDPYSVAAVPCTSVVPSTKIKPKPSSTEVSSSGYEEVYSHDNRHTSVYVSAKTSSKPASNDVLPVKNKPEPASKDVHSDGYEKAKPHHDNGYMIVDLSSDKEHTVPAADGVYSKLHHPVRNLTNVYNEWSA